MDLASDTDDWRLTSRSRCVTAFGADEHSDTGDDVIRDSMVLIGLFRFLGRPPPPRPRAVGDDIVWKFISIGGNISFTDAQKFLFLFFLSFMCVCVCVRVMCLSVYEKKQFRRYDIHTQVCPLRMVYINSSRATVCSYDRCALLLL